MIARLTAAIKALPAWQLTIVSTVLIFTATGALALVALFTWLNERTR